MIEVEELAVELDAEAGLVRAIDGLALTLSRGETFALVGESGCGKSMTALALMRLLPESGLVTAGSVRVAGEEVLDLPEAAMRRVRGARIGMIFQEPATSLNPVMRIGQQIVEAIEAHTPLRGDAARAKAVQWLERVGIPEPARRIDDYPFRMSGGQKQRVMIAIALAAEPDFLVADEPTTALDVTIQAQVLELLKDLQRERGMGLLLITHDLAVVAGMAQRVALMYAGQIVEVAPAEEFFRAPRHPYAQALLRALPGRGPRGGELQAIGGTVPALTQAFGGCRFALEEFCKAFFEVDAVKMRFRASHFPFTEPSMEVDIDAAAIGKPGRWLEILGSGMVHPNVIRNCGLDPEKYQGFAFGMGLDRITMLKYGIPDLRDMFSADLRWMKHYGFVPLDVPTLAGGLSG